MANNTKGNVWALDTAGVITTKPVITLGFLFKPAAGNQAVLVKDNSGVVICDLKAPADITVTPQVGEFTGERVVYQGLNLESIGGGTLYVKVA